MHSNDHNFLSVLFLFPGRPRYTTIRIQHDLLMWDLIRAGRSSLRRSTGTGASHSTAPSHMRLAGSGARPMHLVIPPASVIRLLIGISAAMEIENEQPNGRGQVRMLPLRFDRPNELRDCHMSLNGNFLEGSPKCILQADACLVAGDDERTLADGRFHGLLS